MVLCKFFAQGKCRNGNNCSFEHPQEPNFQSNNRFAALQSPEHGSSHNYGRSHTQRSSSLLQHPKYTLNKETIVTDLSMERPTWILSAYSPSPKTAIQLFGGPLREQSCEEMRLHHYNALAAGNPAAAIQEVEALTQRAEQQIRTVLSNIDGAMEFIRNGENEHPNRDDICEFSMKNPGQPLPVLGSASLAPAVNPFGDNRQLATAFGQQSALGHTPNPFSSQSQSGVQFGQPARPGAFGQPSTLGQKQNPFASSSATIQGPSGATGPSPFAAVSNPFSASSQPATSNLFGQPSPAQLSPVGQPAVTSGTPGSGQKSAVLNPFGIPLQPHSNSFAIPAQANHSGLTQPAQVNPFGQSEVSDPFGNPAALSPPQSINPFGQARLPAAPNTVNSFGQRASTTPSVTANPFGPPILTSANPNLFEKPAITEPLNINVFGQPQTGITSTATNPFASTPASASVQSGDSLTIGVGENTPYAPNSSYQHPPLRSYASVDATNRLTMFKGRPVVYKDNEPGFQNRSGKWEKIWFPEGAPSYNKDTELSDDAYTDELKASYRRLRETGSFVGGVMPFLPPKREYCLWDF